MKIVLWFYPFLSACRSPFIQSFRFIDCVAICLLFPGHCPRFKGVGGSLNFFLKVPGVVLLFVLSPFFYILKIVKITGIAEKVSQY